MQPLPSSGMSCARPFGKLRGFTQSESTRKGFCVGSKLFEAIWAVKGVKKKRRPFKEHLEI